MLWTSPLSIILADFNVAKDGDRLILDHARRFARLHVDADPFIHARHAAKTAQRLIFDEQEFRRLSVLQIDWNHEPLQRDFLAAEIFDRLRDLIFGRPSWPSVERRQFVIVARQGGKCDRQELRVFRGVRFSWRMRRGRSTAFADALADVRLSHEPAGTLCVSQYVIDAPSAMHRTATTAIMMSFLCWVWWLLISKVPFQIWDVNSSSTQFKVFCAILLITFGKIELYVSKALPFDRDVDNFASKTLRPFRAFRSHRQTRWSPSFSPLSALACAST